MIRLTVLYNLPDDGSEDEFLEWRLSEHQATNANMPGVARTDFGRISEVWPDGSMPPYRFQTTIDWPDRDSFERGFYDDSVQEKLRENLKRLGEHAFIVSEVLVEDGYGTR